MQPPNAESRKAVQSKTPQLPNGGDRIQLDDEPDVREVARPSIQLVLLLRAIRSVSCLAAKKPD